MTAPLQNGTVRMTLPSGRPAWPDAAEPAQARQAKAPFVATEIVSAVSGRAAPLFTPPP